MTIIVRKNLDPILNIKLDQQQHFLDILILITYVMIKIKMKFITINNNSELTTIMLIIDNVLQQQQIITYLHI